MKYPLLIVLGGAFIVMSVLASAPVESAPMAPAQTDSIGFTVPAFRIGVDPTLQWVRVLGFRQGACAVRVRIAASPETITCFDREIWGVGLGWLEIPVPLDPAVELEYAEDQWIAISDLRRGNWKRRAVRQ